MGGFSGKVANVVGSSWKGIAVMKSLPLSVANPRTTAQVEQRREFTEVTQFASQILSQLIKPLWDRFAQKMSGFNDFVRTNINVFGIVHSPAYPDLVIAKGKMVSIPILAVCSANDDVEVQLQFDPTTTDPFAISTDQTHALVINETQDVMATRKNAAVRGSGTVVIDLPTPAATGDVLHCYMAFIREDGTIVSDTSYEVDSV